MSKYNIVGRNADSLISRPCSATNQQLKLTKLLHPDLFPQLEKESISLEQGSANYGPCFCK